MNISIVAQFNQFHTDHSNIYKTPHTSPQKCNIHASIRIDCKVLKRGDAWTELHGVMRHLGVKRSDVRNQLLQHTVFYR